MTKCLHQFMRSERKMFIEGVGDCTTCTCNKENENCKMYSPVTMMTMQMEVVERAEALE